MRRVPLVLPMLLVLTLGFAAPATAGDAAIVADHTAADLAAIPLPWIKKAKASLHIAYGHTSHGSQITTGMQGLARWKGATYAFRNGGEGDALDLRDRAMPGARDLGNPNRTAWAAATRTYLDAHPELNVVMWSWCGQAATSLDNIDIYLDLMDALVADYPAVRFVYMTGHLDGTGLEGNLHRANERIRAHCRKHGRILFDFADIESYDPDGVYYGDRRANDRCDYDSDGDGRPDRNWAREWQVAHEEGVAWYPCSSAHSAPLNANLKAYAAWWLFARLAGWPGAAGDAPDTIELERFLTAGRDAEARGDPVLAYRAYRAALAAAHGARDLPDDLTDRLRDARTHLRTLEKDEAVRAEKKAWSRLERTLRTSHRDLEKVAADAEGTPSAAQAAALAAEIRALLERSGFDAPPATR